MMPAGPVWLGERLLGRGAGSPSLAPAPSSSEQGLQRALPQAGAGITQEETEIKKTQKTTKHQKLRNRS